MGGLVGGAAAVVLDAWTLIASFVVVSMLVARSVGSLAGRRDLGAALDRRVAGPLGGALFGAVPGCGGAIAVVSLYGRGTVGFGTVLAALVATAGDSAFVLLAVAPRTALAVYGVAFLVAVALGVAVNEFGLASERVARVSRAVETGYGGAARPDGAGRDRAGGGVTALRRGVLGLWWLAAAVGIAAGLHRATGGGVPRLAPPGLSLLAASVGVALSVGIALGPEQLVGAPRGGRLRAVAVESAPVVTWIAAGLAGYRGLTAVVDVGAVSGVPAAGPLAAVAGGLLGAIPGCGVHVGFVTGYAEGAVPLSALVANAISQDGDAVFALFAVDRVAAVVATVYTVFPGVVVGLVIAAL
jgi:hypothetical protein